MLFYYFILSKFACIINWHICIDIMLILACLFSFDQNENSLKSNKDKFWENDLVFFFDCHLRHLNTSLMQHKARHFYIAFCFSVNLINIKLIIVIIVKSNPDTKHKCLEIQAGEYVLGHMWRPMTAWSPHESTCFRFDILRVSKLPVTRRPSMILRFHSILNLVSEYIIIVWFDFI